MSKYKVGDLVVWYSYPSLLTGQVYEVLPWRPWWPFTRYKIRGAWTDLGVVYQSSIRGKTNAFPAD